MHKKLHLSPAVIIAISAAVLFGASTPFAKLLIDEFPPILLAGVLYLGSGIGLLLFRIVKDKGWKATGLKGAGWFWLIGSIIFGGILAPTLLMLGLLQSSAAMASLLLNFEGVLTAVLAWVIFKEHTDKRMIIGMLLIVVGGVVLVLPNHLSSDSWFSSVMIIFACLCWGIDNNLTRNISASDSLFIAGSKGFFAGAVNVTLGLMIGLTLPSLLNISYAMLIGFLGYGISLVLFVLALRGLGTARSGAYFSTAPFIGAAIAIIFFNDVTSISFWIAAIFMMAGVWIHLTESHSHKHSHEKLNHNHFHHHDAHHQHKHDFEWDNSKPHAHAHQHEKITHSHQHYPDIHHRHDHDEK